MRFVKRLIILSGGGGKGTLGIEKNAYGTNVKLSLYGPQLLDGALVLRIDGKYFSRVLSGGRGSFSLDGVESLDLVHAAVFGGGQLSMYGTNDPHRLGREEAESFEKHIKSATKHQKTVGQAVPLSSKMHGGEGQASAQGGVPQMACENNRQPSAAQSETEFFGRAVKRDEFGLGHKGGSFVRGESSEDFWTERGAEYLSDSLLVDGYSSGGFSPRQEKSEYHDEQIADENYYTGVGSYSQYAESAGTEPPIAPKQSDDIAEEPEDFDVEYFGEEEDSPEGFEDDAADEGLDENYDGDLNDDYLNDDYDDNTKQDNESRQKDGNDLDRDFGDDFAEQPKKSFDKFLEKGKGFVDNEGKNNGYIKRIIPNRPKIVNPSQSPCDKRVNSESPADMAYKFLMNKSEFACEQNTEPQDKPQQREGQSKMPLQRELQQIKPKPAEEKEEWRVHNRGGFYYGGYQDNGIKREKEEDIKDNRTSRERVESIKDEGIKQEKRRLKPESAGGNACSAESECIPKTQFAHERVGAASKEERTKGVTSDPHIKARQGTFFEQNGDEIERLFSGNREKELEQLLPGSKWVRVDYDVNQYYVIGLIGREFLCYGVPSAYTPVPPEELKGYCWWLPTKPDKPQGKGYWIMYQSLETGESVLPMGEGDEN